MPDVYTKISKPTDSNYTNVAKPVLSGATAIFDFAQFDVATFDTPVDDYTKVSKPTDTTYSSVAKPTT